MTITAKEIFAAFDNLDTAWNPHEELVKQANIQLFLEKHRLSSINKLHERSIQKPESFYESILKELDIPWH